MKLSSPDSKFSSLLKDPESSLNDVLSSNFFPQYWLNSDESLFSFILSHDYELIAIGFQVQTESLYSIRCLQIMSTQNLNFRNRLFAETDILRFVYNYVFNLSLYPHFSQKSYFYVLPNIMVDQYNRLNPVFDTEYFKELANNIDNDFAYNFLVRAITLAPFSVSKVFKKIELEKTVISNFLPQKKERSKFFLVRSLYVFKKIVGTKFEGNSSQILLDKIDSIIQNAIQNPNKETFSFIEFIDEFSMKKFSFSKWKQVHLKISPYLSSFCELLTKSNSKTFTSLSHSLAMVSIGITSTTKTVAPCFISLFRFLMNLFFELRTNTFLHNSCVKAFNLLLSLNQINSNFLDKLDLFKKVTDFYEKIDIDYNVSFKGQLKIISDGMNQFVMNSKTVDIKKWNNFVVKRNQRYNDIANRKYGGLQPINVNAIKIPLYSFLNQPSFFSKNLFITGASPRRNSSPLS